MSIFINDRKAMDHIRTEDVEILKTGIDWLRDDVGSSYEIRKEAADITKNLLDTYVQIETTNNKLEYVNGRLAGIAIAIGVQVIGYAVIKGTKYLKNKNT